MATQLLEFYFNTLSDANPAPVPSGFALTTGAGNGRILSGFFQRSSGTSIWRYSTPFLSNEMEASFRLADSLSGNSSLAGITFVTASGNGYMCSYVVLGVQLTVAIYVVTASVIAATPLATSTFSNTGLAGTWVEFYRNKATGVMNVYVNDVFRITATDVTYSPDAAGPISAGATVRAIRLIDLADNYINSFNSTNDIIRGQENVAYLTTGFSDITAVTSDKPGLTVGNIVDDTTGDGTVSISDFVEGGLYPALPSTVVYTFSDGTLTSQVTKTLTKKSTETSVNTVGLITINDNFLGYHFLAAGRSIADGCQIFYPTTAGFVINADGSFSTPEILTLPIWYRDVTNGRMYEFNITFTMNRQPLVIDLSDWTVQSESPIYDGLYHHSDRP